MYKYIIVIAVSQDLTHPESIVISKITLWHLLGGPDIHMRGARVFK